MQCIVNSYLQWLQDSDFKDECAICKSSLKEGELIRLCCLGMINNKQEKENNRILQNIIQFKNKILRK